MAEKNEMVAQVMLPVASCWKPPNVPRDGGLTAGDMPGDKALIGEQHIQKANKLFPKLLELLPPMLDGNPFRRAVLGICGGSGVGKTETAALLAHYFRQAGIGAYTLSGDNYPHRIPSQNDAERLRIFRDSGIKGLVSSGRYTPKTMACLQKQQKEDKDAEPQLRAEHPWLEAYQEAGNCSLMNYLGTPAEIDFEDLNQILLQFKNGATQLYLKRMGRQAGATWYDQVDFQCVQLLLIEWTHANSHNLRGVDLPILLYSTPEETLAHRMARARDKGVDSPFTSLVLNIEARQLEARAFNAHLILSNQGKLISYAEFLQTVASNRKNEGKT